MTDEEKARSILNAALIFRTGCSNTMHGEPPESCEPCRAEFLRQAGIILRDERGPIPDTLVEAAGLIAETMTPDQNPATMIADHLRQS